MAWLSQKDGTIQNICMGRMRRPWDRQAERSMCDDGGLLVVGQEKAQKLRIYNMRNVVLYPDRCGSNVIIKRPSIMRVFLNHMTISMDA